MQAFRTGYPERLISSARHDRIRSNSRRPAPLAAKVRSGAHSRTNVTTGLPVSESHGGKRRELVCNQLHGVRSIAGANCDVNIFLILRTYEILRRTYIYYYYDGYRVCPPCATINRFAKASISNFAKFPILGPQGIRISMTPPAKPKIYHIVHVDRLPSIIADGAALVRCRASGKSKTWHDNRYERNQAAKIGKSIEQPPRSMRWGLLCPFYFCPRSVMLFLIHKHNRPGLEYLGGQDRIVHLEAGSPTRQLHGRTSMGDAGHLRYPMQARITSRTGATCRN